MKPIYTANDKKISNIEITDKSCVIKFEDSTGIEILDDGQCCCESRYMNCDDGLNFFKGANFISVELGDCDRNDDDRYDVREIQFVKVNTSKGTFTLANYNEHNGYYGGFDIEVKEV